MYVNGYHNFYPGTIGLSNEVSDKLSDILINTEQHNFVVDGFESCLETGYGCYAENLFLRNFYNKCRAHNYETLVTGSNFTQYTWHVMSQSSWGEWDLVRGFRGTMLDYRIDRQLRLIRNLMPNKMGQYQPDKATVDDISWIMALSAGWDSGLDMQINIDKFKLNPQYEEILKTIQLWTEARDKKVFTEKQKMELRQTDIQYKLSKNLDGSFKLDFDKYWHVDSVKILPSSILNARPVNGGKESVMPCSINWFWTHNPATYAEIGLSDDLLYSSEKDTMKWLIDYPIYADSTISWYSMTERHFQFVLRVPSSADCGACNFKVSVDGKILDIPVTLHPGEYISIPHIIPMACIYNAKHKVIGEQFFRGSIPVVKTGSTVTVGLSCEPLDKSKKANAILNIRCQNGYFFPSIVE